MHVQADTRLRVSLAKLLGTKARNRLTLFDATISKDGTIMLKPLEVIPASEKWVWDKPGLVGQIQQGIKDAKEGKAKAFKDIR